MKKESVILDDIIKIRGVAKNGIKIGLKASIYKSNLNILSRCLENKDLISLCGLKYMIETYSVVQEIEDVCFISLLIKEIWLDR